MHAVCIATSRGWCWGCSANVDRSRPAPVLKTMALWLALPSCTLSDKLDHTSLRKALFAAQPATGSSDATQQAAQIAMQAGLHLVSVVTLSAVHCTIGRNQKRRCFEKFACYVTLRCATFGRVARKNGHPVWQSTACSPCASLVYNLVHHSTAHRVSFIDDVAQGGQDIRAIRASHQAASLRVCALCLDDLEQDWLTAEDHGFGCWVIAACSTGRAGCPVIWAQPAAAGSTALGLLNIAGLWGAASINTHHCQSCLPYLQGGPRAG